MPAPQQAFSSLAPRRLCSGIRRWTRSLTSLPAAEAASTGLVCSRPCPSRLVSVESFTLDSHCFSDCLSVPWPHRGHNAKCEAKLLPSEGHRVIPDLILEQSGDRGGPEAQCNLEQDDPTARPPPPPRGPTWQPLEAEGARKSLSCSRWAKGSARSLAVSPKGGLTRVEKPLCLLSSQPSSQPNTVSRTFLCRRRTSDPSGEDEPFPALRQRLC